MILCKYLLLVVQMVSGKYSLCILAIVRNGRVGKNGASGVTIIADTF